MFNLAATLALAVPVFGLGGIPGDVTLEPVFAVNSFPQALGLKPAEDGSGRLFVIQQDGIVRVIDGGGQILAQPFISLGSLVTVGGERGLLDLAFHPEFLVNGRFFLHYSAGTDRPPGTAAGDTVVAEFSVSADPNVANPTPTRIILTVTQDFSNHNGGQMRFGPDGYLYLGLGDGGSGNDPCDRGQTLDPALIVVGGSCRNDPRAALLGKMLRVDVDQVTPAGPNNLCAANADGSANYALPPDNPFVGEDDRCGEVFAYGLRNPWRWSFDRLTGDLWIGDVGQNTWEEIDLLPWPPAAGVNWGWKVCEGSFLRGSISQPCNLPGAVGPVLEYRTGQNGNCSVTGGYRYRGPVSSLWGTYIYGDFCSGRIWFAQPSGGGWASQVFSVQGTGLRSFGEDAAGRLYVVRSGGLWRFEGEEGDLIFDDGFE